MARSFLAGALLAWTGDSALTLTPQNAEYLRQAAESAKWGDYRSCSGIDEAPTDIERDFATDPIWKYFTYDTYDGRTWHTLDGLETCLRSVPGGSTNTWVGATDVWEAQKLIYRQLGETAGPSVWVRHLWIELNPVPNNESVISTAAELLAPMSSMGSQAWLQQPCNAYSNAAFYEVSLQACGSTLPDFGGDWPWRNEIIAAGALMAYGSFAMHGNPMTEPYDTGSMDRVSMDVLFFVFHQAAVRSMAVDHNDPNLAPIIGVLKNDQLCALNPDTCTYGDSREAVRLYNQVLTGPTDGWNVITAMRDTIPEYKIASVAMVLMSLKAIINEELFGASANDGMAMLCNILVEALVTPESMVATAKSQFCDTSSVFFVALTQVKWRVPLDIAKCMAIFVSVLEALIEGMFWQETLVQPGNYLQKYLENNVVNVSSCWRQTHGNWHRVAAQMMKKLLTFLTEDIGRVTRETLTEQQKEAAWDGFQKVPSAFVAFVNTLKTMSGADQVNLCRVFKLAKEVATSGEPMNWEVMPMFDAQGVNSLIVGLVEANDPLVDPVEPFNQDVKDPTGACNYKLENAKVDEITGLAGLRLEDLVVDGSYAEDSSWENTAIQMNIGLRTCPISLKVKASATFKGDGGKLNFGVVNLCGASWKITAEVDVVFRVASVVAHGKAELAKLFASDPTALSAGLDTLDIDITTLEFAYFDISNFPGEAIIKAAANTALKIRLREEIEKTLEKKLTDLLGGALSDAAKSAGSKVDMGSSERRLSTCTAVDGSSQMISFAFPRALPQAMLAILAAWLLL